LGATVLHYQVYPAEGAGQAGRVAVVLLHGLGSSGEDWELQAPALRAQGWPVVTVDLRGHGRSVAVGGGRGWTVEMMADDVAAVLDHLALEGVGQAGWYVVGLSLGGCVALALAAQCPERVRGLVLVNTFARLRLAGLRGLRRLAARAWLLGTRPMDALAAYIARGLFPKPEQAALYEAARVRLARNGKRAYWAGMRAVGRMDLRGALGQVRCPTLVVAGDRDQTVPRAAAEALRDGIRGARLVVVEDSGHATPIDQAEVFNREVVEFFLSLSTDATDGSDD
jgi:3-oxoadipate enol-lactonase